jgi:S-adenosylmethionine:tRNA ribosyltransferase-isomerase
MPPAVRSAVRLLALDPEAGTRRDLHFSDLRELLSPGDLLIVNDAATVPASLSGTDPHGHPIELRLAAHVSASRWHAVIFGDGDWRQRTEDRPAPFQLDIGARLRFDDLSAVVVSITPATPRLIEVEFDRSGAELWSALYRIGRPVQYSYLERELPIWSIQTVFGARPWAVEMPSAGRPFDWETLIALRRRGVEIATITHAAGLSATGDSALDAALPLPERFDIPAPTVEAIARTRARGGRVVAVGTTVVRALEGAANANQGTLSPGEGTTDLLIDADFVPRVVDGLLTGMHESAESHFRLLGAFAPRPTLEAALAHAIEHGYRTHEFGDVTLILAGGA